MTHVRQWGFRFVEKALIRERVRFEQDQTPALSEVV